MPLLLPSRLLPFLQPALGFKTKGLIKEHRGDCHRVKSPGLRLSYCKTNPPRAQAETAAVPVAGRYCAKLYCVLGKWCHFMERQITFNTVQSKKESWCHRTTSVYRAHTSALCWLSQAGLRGATVFSSSPGVGRLAGRVPLWQGQGGKKATRDSQSLLGPRLGTSVPQFHLIPSNSASRRTRFNIEGWGRPPHPLAEGTARSLGKSGDTGRGKSQGQCCALRGGLRW